MTNDVFLAVDLGGTKAEAALVMVDERGRGAVMPGSRHRQATGRAISADALTRVIRSLVTAALASAPAPVAGAGVGAAGPIDLGRGTVSPLNLPEIREFPLRDLVESAAGAPATLRLDGTCIALAEHWLGATRGAATSLGMVVSTGVGGGLIVDGRLLSGTTGNAGHVGQLHVVDPWRAGDAGAGAGGERAAGARDAGVEPAGSEGTTLEETASGPATVAWARRHGWRGETGEDLAAAVAAGDPVADTATRRSAEAVGQAIASVSALVDLEVVAIGGGFSRVRTDYLDLVDAAVIRWSALPRTRPVMVRPSGLSADGPLLGAAALRARADLL
ncbi:ROK family protein [Microbacterium sp. ABRD28]|uniref:ROK family protein n=1 Tax=Microbacterium sp. ABRD28 TaxID=2268461 RepID=UPI000F55027E|nr:ROK family protein [Microbacterium sp. ABRD28]AZC13039.1 ROK family protein [Microbacterium sp. ABRD28]